MTKKIIGIWAEDENHLIGVDDKMPWYLPKELAHFKETTMGATLLMGRVTFDGMKRRVLPGRKTIILTRDNDFQVEGVSAYHTISEVLDWFSKQDKDLFIVGGASIYKIFENHYDMIIQTRVHHKFKGDTYFPDLDLSSFKVTKQEFFEKDENNKQDFTITIMEK